MQDRFAAYYRPGDDELGDLWSDALIVPDANVLLHLYSYTEVSRAAFLDVFAAAEDRLWLPEQIAREFHRHRPDRKAELVETYEDHGDAVEAALREFEAARDRLLDLVDELQDDREHPVVDDARLDQARKVLTQPVPELREPVDAAREALTIVGEDPIASDALTDRLGELFDGRTGDGFDDDELAAIYEEGQARFEENRPPGYADADKPEKHRRFGDLVIWRSMLRRAEAEDRPVVFVTADVKEDWWWHVEGDRLAPRAELREEIRETAGTDFYAYTPERFLQVADERLDVDVGEAALEEARRREARYRRIGELLDERDELRGHRDRIDGRRRRIEAAIASTEEEIEATEAALDDAGPGSDRWTELRTRLDRLEDRRDELQDDLERAERDRADVEDRLDEIQAALDDLFDP